MASIAKAISLPSSNQAILAITNLQARCSERGCPFLVSGPDGFCRHHFQMFSLESSPSELSIEATDEDIYSAIFYDESVTVAKKGMVSVEEWLEQKQWKKTYSNALASRLRKRHREAGLCNCGGIRIVGMSRCNTCVRRDRVRGSVRKANGLCVKCGKNDAAIGRVTCSSCRRKQSVYTARVARHRKSIGLCVVCGKSPNRTGNVRCADCAAEKCAYSQRRKESGVCVSCGDVNDRQPKKDCLACAQRQSARNQAKSIDNPERYRQQRRIRNRRRRNSLRKAGLCIECAKSPSPPGTLCRNCRTRRNKVSAAHKLRTKEEVNEKESDYRNEHSAGD
jgi:hypothetical protein